MAHENLDNLNFGLEGEHDDTGIHFVDHDQARHEDRLRRIEALHLIEPLEEDDDLEEEQMIDEPVTDY